MNTITSVSTAPTNLVARRGELMAELFLQELEPAFVAQPVTDFAYDFFIGFSKPDGGINTYAVEVKATEQPINGKLPDASRPIPPLGKFEYPRVAAGCGCKA